MSDATRAGLAGGAALAAGAACYLLFVASFAVDVPQHDDYDDALRTMTVVATSDDPAERHTAFWAQHNDHLTWWNRVVYRASLAATGELDFRLLILFGNLAVVGLALFYAWALRDEAGRPWIPLAVLALLQPAAHQSVLWAMAALSNFWPVLFAALTFALLTRPGVAAVAGAALLATAASFGQSNGLLVWPVGLWLLLRRGGPPPKAELGVWLAAATFVLALFLACYAPSPYALETRAAVLDQPAHAAWLYARWLLRMLGAPLALGRDGAALWTGGVAVALAAAALASDLRTRRPALYALLLFLVGSVALAAFAHHQSFVSSPLTPRYRFYTIHLWMLCALAIGQQALSRRGHAPRRLGAALLCVGLAIQIAGYAAAWRPAHQTRAQLAGGLRHWLATRQGTAGLVLNPNFVPDAPDVLERAIAAGIYRPPAR